MKHEGLIESIRARLLNLSRASGETFDYVLASNRIDGGLCSGAKGHVECISSEEQA